MVLNIIRMFSVNSTTFVKVNPLLDDVEIQFNYNSTVLALVQVSQISGVPEGMRQAE
jgi:hypothetical protein